MYDKVKFSVLSISVLLFLVSAAYAQSFKFAVMTDSRGSYNGVNEPVLSELVKHLIANHSDIKFLLFPGDFANGSKTGPDSTYQSWLFWKEIMSPIYKNDNLLTPKIFVTVGNHDVQNRFDETNFRKTFPDMPQNGPEDEKGLTYSFDFMNTHIIMITTNRWYYGNPEDTTDDRRDWRYIKHMDWLEKDIISAKEKGAEHIFVLGHEPAFPVGGHLRDCLPNLGKDVKLPLDSTRRFYLDNRNIFWNIMTMHKVSAYICGHEHVYGRENIGGVYHITAGSAGAPLYDFNPVYGAPPSDNPALDREFKNYDEAVPYYEILNYNFGSGMNSQASEDFIGYSAFHYCVFEVNGETVKVTVYGAFPKKGTNTVMEGEIKQIDYFEIKR